MKFLYRLAVIMLINWIVLLLTVIKILMEI